MPKPKLRLRDWLFGGAGKRRLLLALLLEEQRVWTQVELARAAGLKEKGSVDDYLVALDQLDLLSRGGDGSYRFNRRHPIVEPLRELLDLIEAVPDDALHRAP